MNAALHNHKIRCQKGFTSYPDLLTVVLDDLSINGATGLDGKQYKLTAPARVLFNFLLQKTDKMTYIVEDRYLKQINFTEIATIFNIAPTNFYKYMKVLEQLQLITDYKGRSGSRWSIEFKFTFDIDHYETCVYPDLRIHMINYFSHGVSNKIGTLINSMKQLSDIKKENESWTKQQENQFFKYQSEYTLVKKYHDMLTPKLSHYLSVYTKAYNDSMKIAVSSEDKQAVYRATSHKMRVEDINHDQPVINKVINNSVDNFPRPPQKVVPELPKSGAGTIPESVAYSKNPTKNYLTKIFSSSKTNSVIVDNSNELKISDTLTTAIQLLENEYATQDNQSLELFNPEYISNNDIYPNYIFSPKQYFTELTTQREFLTLISSWISLSSETQNDELNITRTKQLLESLVIVTQDRKFSPNDVTTSLREYLKTVRNHRELEHIDVYRIFVEQYRATNSIHILTPAANQNSSAKITEQCPDIQFDLDPILNQCSVTSVTNERTNSNITWVTNTECFKNVINKNYENALPEKGAAIDTSGYLTTSKKETLTVHPVNQVHHQTSGDQGFRCYVHLSDQNGSCRLNRTNHFEQSYLQPGIVYNTHNGDYIH